MSVKRKFKSEDTGDNNNDGGPSSSNSKKCTKLDLDLLKCPICYEYPRNEVFQCSIGHSICSYCIHKLKNQRCPECLSSYSKEGGKTRNFLVERLLNSMQFDCPWKDNGCDKGGFRRQDLSAHENHCSHNPNLIKICSLLGGNSGSCPYQVSPTSLEDSNQLTTILDHLKRKHNVRTTLTYCDEIRNYQYCPNYFKQLTTELLVKQENPNSPRSVGYLNCLGEIYRLVDRSTGSQIGLYVILGRMDVVNSDVNFSWAFIRLTDENCRSADIAIKVSLRSPCPSRLPDVPELSWRGEQLDAVTAWRLQMMDHAKMPKFKFSLPFTHICEHYVNEQRQFVVEFSFIRK